ncbi:hypothetical protein [Romboutsia ilealis]|uniref:hypothetical protein n=1 Tax=Romboutsia ilealis TaxID=1115758 RepID=UPI00272C6EEC|nr:hypothetical protein [Romboutsia ilealis]
MNKPELFNNMIEVLGYFADQCDMFKPLLDGVTQLQNEAEIQSLVIDDLTITIMDITMGDLTMNSMRTTRLCAATRSVAMYDRLKRMFLTGKIDETYLNQAVNLGWITTEECEEIKGLKTPIIIEEENPVVSEI